MLAVTFAIMADPSSNSHETHATIILEKDHGSGHLKRPKAPDRQVVTCAYDGEVMTLSFVIPEGNATLTVTDEYGQYITYSVDTSTLNVSVSVGDLKGFITVQLDTERGNHFHGII